MKVFKFLANDIVLFLINIFIVMVFYFNYLYNSFNILSEIFFIGVFYYVTSLFTSLCVICILYIFVRKSFPNYFSHSFIKKLEIISFTFNKFYDDIDNICDFKSKLRELNCRC